MKVLAGYDGALQMLIEAPRDVGVRRLRFLRWLVERGELEDDGAGPLRGRHIAAVPAGPDDSAPPAP